MNPLTGLTEYLGRVERRLRVLTWTQGAAIAAGAALVFTVLAVLVANGFAFSEPSVVWGRVLIFVALALAIGIGLVVPLLRLNRHRAARATERKFPEFEERLLTFTERSEANPEDPFLPLLAADTLAVAEHTEPARVAGRSRILSFVSAAAVALIVLIWLGTSGPGYLGYGTSLLWGGLPKGEITPYYDIFVQPGNHTVRRRSDQIISAQLHGFQAQRVRMFAKYASSSQWEQADMRPRLNGAGFEFLIAGVPESLEYYVEAGGVRSKQYKLNVVDLPGIERIKVTYHFPGWTGMKDKVEDPGGDLRAVEGTDAEVAVRTDRPLVNGALLFDDGTKVLLRAGEGGLRVASVPIRKDGMYHIASVEQGEDVRLSQDYFIEAQRDEPPTVRITRPTGDARVNPIEEVTVAVEGQDDFGLNELSLHYSVNGGPEKTVSLLKGKGLKTASGTSTIYLEDYQLAPGDLVSLYATSRDAHSTAKTDMFFVEAEPFEREYSQSQESGGGAGGEQDENRISQREKEIIAATWNQIKDTTGNRTAAAENAGFLSGVQAKLRDQAHSLAERMKARQLAGATQEMKSFTEDMEKAVEAMGPAADKLRASQWQNALAPEQKALQYLLRAEATFRSIRVAFGSRGAGGGGSGAGRDLQSLFDLELDTEKNQYESGQPSASADNRQREIDEALQKLEQLARRQQELAEQQKNQQMAQQRWQQEMLRREAEQLQRQMEQLSRGQQQGQSSQQQSSQQQSGQSGRSGQSGQVSSQQLQRAIEQLSQAQRDMRQSASGQSEADARRAAERLQQARDMLKGMRQQQAAGNVDDLTRKTEEMAQRQQEFANKMRRAFGAGAQSGQNTTPQQGQGATPQQAEEMAGEKEQMASDFQKLEAEMGKAVRDNAGTNRELSNKLREALGDLQQDELNNRMRWTADALRRGLGSYAVMRDAITTQALNKLRDDLHQIQKSLGDGRQAGGGKDGKDRKALEQALAETERLRQQMEKGLQPGGKGLQPGGKGQEAGLQPGGNGQEAGDGERGISTEPGSSAMNRGGWRPSSGPAAGDTGVFVENYRETLRQLENNPQIGKDVRDMIRDMYRLDPRLFPGNPEMLNRIEGQMLSGVEQIELQLRRMLDDQQGGQVRSGPADTVPPGYADAVAEYFRRLSKEPR